MTEPVPPPLFEGSPHDLWQAARELGDEPALEWTFPIFVDRVLAASPHGLDLAYEYLQGWDHVVGFLNQEDVLGRSPHSELLFAHRSMGIGLAVHDSFLSTANGILDRPRAGERFRGRHYAAVVGLSSSGRLAIRNSWGDGWGRHGFAYLGRAYFEAYVEQVTVTYPAWIGWSPTTDRVIKSASMFSHLGADGLTAAAATPIRIQAKTVAAGGNQLDLRMRRLLSRASWDRFDVIELRSANVLIGRAHLLHDATAGQGLVMELWVPPPYRRRGYGSILLKELTLLAKANQELKGLTVPLFEADCSREGEHRARRFMDTHLFAWSGLSQRNPPIRDFARHVFAGTGPQLQH